MTYHGKEREVEKSSFGNSFQLHGQVQGCTLNKLIHGRDNLSLSRFVWLMNSFNLLV